jgi:hemolysin activation/secretion protein
MGMKYKLGVGTSLLLTVFSAYGDLPVGAGNEAGLRPSTKPLVIPEPIPKAPVIDVPQQPAEKSSARKEKAYESKLIVIDTVKFEGYSVFSTDELDQLAKPYLHKPVSVDELEELRRLVTHYYIDKGYITSGATFPKSPIEGNTLRIKIVEGRLGEANIEGTGWLRDDYVKNRLIPDDEAPLNMNELQDRFRLLLTDPLFDHLNGRLSPGAERGFSTLDVDVVRARPYQFSAIIDNYRSPSIGSVAVGANGWVRNLTGQGDLIDLTFLSSAPTGGKSLQYFGNWMMPLGDYGTKAYFSFNNSNTSIIEEPLAALNIKSKTFSVEGGLNQILIDNLDRRLTFGVGVGFKENDTTLLGRSFSFVPGQLLGKNQVSFVRINQEYIERWEKVVVAMRSTFSVGLHSFGSTINDNSLYPDSQFFAWLGQTQGVWHLPYVKSDLILRGTMQLSNDPLMPLERMAVGGRYTVRGYRENQLVRDNGYSGSAEIHIPLLGDSEDGYSVKLVPFFDYGAAWNNLDITLVKPTTQYLYSTGVGIQFQVPHFSGEFFWAHRLENKTIQQHGDLQDDGIHFQAHLDAF